MKKNRNRRVLFYPALKKCQPMIRWSLFLFLFGITRVFATDGHFQQPRFSMNFERTKTEKSISSYKQQMLGDQMTKKVQGQVTSDDGELLPGVTVVVKGTVKGTITDIQGNYSLNNVSDNDVLIFSFVGMKQQEIAVINKTSISVVMQAATIGIEEVIAVGYGTQKKATLTGAIAAIKSKDLVTTKNENVVNMLTGKVAGVRILQRSSEPGSFDNIYDIRGLGNPLIVIDGIPRSGDEMSRMDPNEIENISVLKDASAAIYGVRAANGVILITTKNGTKNKDGKFEISYSYNYGIQEFPDLPHGVNAIEYMTLKNEQQKRSFASNFISQQAPAFSDEDMELYRNGTLKSTDWVGATMKNSTPIKQHNLSLNGGSGKVDYFFNLGYIDQDGMYKSGDLNYNRWNFRSNVNVKITDRLRGKVLISGYTDEKNQPSKSVWEIFKYTWNQLPTDQIYANNNPDYPHVEPDNANPVSITDADMIGGSTYTNRNFQGQFSLEYDIPGIKGLTAKGMYNYGYSMADNNASSKAYNLYEYDSENTEYISTRVNSPSSVTRGFSNITSTLFQLSLNYTRKFGEKHNVSGLMLYEEGHSESDNFYSKRELSLDGVPYLFAGNTTNQEGSMDPNGLWETVNKGLVGKFNYDFKGKYLAEFSFRYDGSCKFASGSQWGFFPAGSVGWRLSEEPFMQNLISPDILNNLKFRGSYGKLGDDSATGFQYISGYNYPSGGYISGGNYVNGVSSRGVVNPNLTWYTAKTLNMGLDVGLWNGLLGGSFDYFVRNREGLLATRTTTLPGTVGTDLPQENLNSDQTRGFELVLTHRNKIGEFGYHVSANVSTTRTKLKDVQETRSGNAYLNWRNSQQNRYTKIWWGKECLGRFTSYEQIENYQVNTGGGNQNIVPGDYYYADLNGDGVVDSKDEKPIAIRDIPLVNFGMTIGFDWKGFDFNMLLQGAAKFDVKYAEQMGEPLMYGRNTLTWFLDRWHTVDPEADVFDPNTEWVSGKYPAMGSPVAEGTAAVQDASYLRIKNIEIGYSFSRKLLNRIGIAKLRVYVNGYNLATFTGLANGVDPEHPGEGSDGEDWNNSQGGYKYPLSRTFNIGAKITF